MVQSKNPEKESVGHGRGQYWRFEAELFVRAQGPLIKPVPRGRTKGVQCLSTVEGDIEWWEVRQGNS